MSAWLTGLRETVEQLPEFVRVAAEAGVREVYLRRLVFFEENAIGKARADQALYEQLSREDARHIDRAIANNPLFLKDLTPWPVNISWALLANRSSCFAGREMAIAFAPLSPSSAP